MEAAKDGCDETASMGTVPDLRFLDLRLDVDEATGLVGESLEEDFRTFSFVFEDEVERSLDLDNFEVGRSLKWVSSRSSANGIRVGPPEAVSDTEEPTTDDFMPATYAMESRSTLTALSFSLCTTAAPPDEERLVEGVVES